MPAVAERVEMAKQPGRPKSNRDDVTIRVSRPVARKLKAIADDRGVIVAELVDELFTKALDRAYVQMLRKGDEGTGDASTN